MSRREARSSLNVRQNDALAEFESWKKKLMVANRHIAKMNASLSIRIEELNGQNSSLYVENLRLRASEIALISQLKREREKSRKVMSEAEAATISLTKHLGFLRKSYHISSDEPAPPEPAPPPHARRPPSQPYPTSPGQQMQQNRISRLPEVPGIVEDEEPEDELPQTAPRKSKSTSATTSSNANSSAKPRLSASRLPLPSRISSPPPGPMPPAQTQLGAPPKRKPSRRQSGMMTMMGTDSYNNFPSSSEEALSVPRAPSPAFGSPIRGARDILAEVEDEEDSPEADWEVEDAELALAIRRPEKTYGSNGKRGNSLRRARTRIDSQEEDDSPPDVDPRTGSKKPKLKDVTNSVQSRSDTGSDVDRRSQTQPPTDAGTSARPSSGLNINTTGTPAPSRYPATLSRAHLATPQPSSSPGPVIEYDNYDDNTLPAVDSLLFDGGRERRTRKSVNYAEPKLNTKMRKPDGAIPGATRKRSSSTSSGSHVPMVYEDDNGTTGDADVESGTPRSSLDNARPSGSSSSSSRHTTTSSSSSKSATTSQTQFPPLPPSRPHSRTAESAAATTIKRKKSRPTIIPSDDEADRDSDGDGEYIPRTTTSTDKPRSKRRSQVLNSTGGIYPE